MKRVLSSLIVAAGIALSSSPSPAQERPGCFMVKTSGQVVNLNEICPKNAQDSTSSVPASGTFRIPIKRKEGGIPVVDVTFNGKHSFEMFFDTGASGTVITQEMAKALDLKIETAAMAQTAGGAVPHAVGRVSSIQVGGLVVKDLAVAVNSYMQLSYGLLGQNFYGNYDITIKEKEIELRIRS